jgi:hypothetical protein
LLVARPFYGRVLNSPADISANGGLRASGWFVEKNYLKFGAAAARAFAIRYRIFPNVPAGLAGHRVEKLQRISRRCVAPSCRIVLKGPLMLRKMQVSAQVCGLTISMICLINATGADQLIYACGGLPRPIDVFQ